LSIRRQLLENVDGGHARAFRLGASTQPPLESRDPAEHLALSLPLVQPAPQFEGTLGCIEGLDRLIREIPLDRVSGEEFGLLLRVDPIDMLHRQPIARQGVHVRGCGRSLVASRGSEPNQPGRVLGFAGMVHDPGDIGVTVDEDIEDHLVQLPAARGRERLFDRPARQFVAVPHRAVADDQESAAFALIEDIGIIVRHGGEEPSFDVARHDRSDLDDLSGFDREMFCAGPHGVANTRRHPARGLPQNLGDEERIPPRHREELIGRAGEVHRQLPDRGSGKGAEVDSAKGSRRHVSHDQSQRMIGRDVLFAERDQEDGVGSAYTLADELEHIERRPIRPVGILDHGQGRRAGDADRIERRVEHFDAGSAGGKDLLEAPADLEGDITKRPERAGRSQVVASTPQDPGVRFVAPHELIDECRLADSRYTTDEDDRTLALSGIDECGLEALEFRVAFDEIPHLRYRETATAR
jgi:hypothetical protein